MLRIGLLRGAAILLYLGPVLAGAADFSWSAVPAFAAIFLLWLVVIRPQDWPEHPRAWLALPAWLALAGRAAVQLVLVSACFVFGRAFGHVTGFEPVFGVGMPLALSLIAVPLARMVFDPERGVAMDQLLDEALLGIAAPGPARPRGAAVGAAQLFAALDALAADAPLTEVEACLSRLDDQIQTAPLYDALLARVQAAPMSQPLCAAFVLHATSQPCAEACRGRAAPVRALQVASGDDRLLALVARRCILLLNADADAWGDCPNAGALEAARSAAGPGAAAALADLIALNRQLAPLNGLDPVP